MGTGVVGIGDKRPWRQAGDRYGVHRDGGEWIQFLLLCRPVVEA